MSFFVVINPHASGGRASKKWEHIWPLAQRILKDPVAQKTEFRGHATEITSEAIRNGYRHIISIGGDGTHNEVINGFFDSHGKLIDEKATFSLIAAGTGSDVARALGQSTSVAASLHRIKHGSFSQKIDLGLAKFMDDEGKHKKRYFVNVASFGLSAKVVRAVNASKIVKLPGSSTLPYLWHALKESALYSHPPTSILIDHEEKYFGPLKYIAIANFKYCGGGMFMAPGADPSDGLFEFVLFENIPFLKSLFLSSKIYSGKHIGRPGVRHCQGKSLEATSTELVEVEMDGECVGRLPVQMTIIPKILHVRY